MAIEHLREANRQRTEDTNKRDLAILEFMVSRGDEILTATQIGPEFGISPKTVSTALRKLYFQGLLKRVVGKRGGTALVPLSHPAEEYVMTRTEVAIEARKSRKAHKEEPPTERKINANSWICQMFPEFEGKDLGEVLYERYGCALIDFNHICRPKRRKRHVYIDDGDGEKARDKPENAQIEGQA